MSESLLFQPVADVELDGAPLEPAIRRSIASIVVLQSFDAPAVTDICLASPPDGTRDKLVAGQPLRVSVDPQLLLFAGTITGVEQNFSANGRYELHIRAHDRLHALRQRRRIRVATEASATSLWQEAASSIGLGLAAPLAGAPRRIVQRGTSDLAFLVAAAADEGLHAAVDGDTLRLVSLAGFDATVELVWGQTLIAIDVEEAAERVAKSSRAYGWDPAMATGFSASAGIARQDQEIDLRSFGLDTLASDDGVLILANRNATSEAKIAAEAQGALDLAAAAQLVVRGTALGEPRLRPGVRVNIGGLPDNDPLTVVVTRATHIFDGQAGFRTEFSSEPPESTKPDDAPIVTLGIVTSIDDPQGQGRCRVDLPAFDGLDAGYASVVVAGAGAAKGAAVLPDVGDEVVMLFPGGDLANGLVLGGLYGNNKLPRGTTTQSPRALVLASGGGQSLRLGGRQKSLALSTANGDVLSLGGGPARLAVSGDLAISAIGGTITIKAARIKFERE